MVKGFFEKRELGARRQSALRFFNTLLLGAACPRQVFSLVTSVLSDGVMLASAANAKQKLWERERLNQQGFCFRVRWTH
jgi:hypothetical protein